MYLTSHNAWWKLAHPVRTASRPVLSTTVCTPSAKRLFAARWPRRDRPASDGELRGYRARSRHHFSDTALGTPSSCTSVHLLSGLYSFIAPAIREVLAPRLH